MTSELEGKLTDEILASYIVDALLRARIIEECNVESALRLAIEELHIRNISGELTYS